MTRTKSTFLALLAVLLSPMAAQADIIITVEELGTDVVFNYSGSIETTGLSSFCCTNGLSFVGFDELNGVSSIAFGVGPELRGWLSVNSLPLFSSLPGFNFFEGSATGMGFALFGSNILGLPFDYISGSMMSGSLTLMSQSFDSLGLIDGIFESYLPSEDYIRMVVDTTAVPEPGTLALLSLGLLGLGLSRRKKV